MSYCDQPIISTFSGKELSFVDDKLPLHKKCKRSPKRYHIESPKKCKKDDPCYKVESPKKCKKDKQCEKDYDDCCMTPPPKTAYEVNICNKIGRLTLSVSTFTEGNRLYIRYILTNSGTATIKRPIYIVDKLTGNHKVSNKKFRSGEVIDKTFKVKCSLATQTTYTANAYTKIVDDCLYLISNPVLITL